MASSRLAHTLPLANHRPTKTASDHKVDLLEVLEGLPPSQVGPVALACRVRMELLQVGSLRDRDSISRQVRFRLQCQ